jgi:hypothetical protein
MELVTILRDLWRRRTLVACAALIAVLAGLAVGYRMSFPPRLESRKYEVGTATARILVDTPDSQVVAVAPKGSDTLGVRANLLASLMVDGVVKSAIARRAGIPDRELVAASSDDPKPSTGPRSNVLMTKVQTNTAGDELPIIEISAQSPTPAGAARLANAAIAGLRDYLDSTAALQKVPDARRLRISGLGGAQARLVVRGRTTIFAMIALIFVFVALNGMILAFDALVRGWRAAAEDERAEAEALDEELAEDAYPAANGVWRRLTPERAGAHAWTRPGNGGADGRATVEPRAESR